MTEPNIMTIAYRAAKAALIELVAEHSGRQAEEIEDDTLLDQLALDSLDMVSIEVGMEDTTGLDLNLQQNFGTVGNVVAYIAAELESQAE